MTRATWFARAMPALACILSAAWVLGQLANRAQSGGQVNPQVNTALYGGGVPASVRYNSVGSTSRAMPSEVRYASWTSGALPSDIRMNYASLGPLHPAGPLAYIPPPGPSYLPKPSTAPPSAIGGAAYSSASIRYSSPVAAPSSTYIAPQSITPQPLSSSLVSRGPINSGPINSGPISRAPVYGAPINSAPINSGPINSGPINSGSIRYGR